MLNNLAPNLIARYFQFVKERFPLGSHLPMVFCFTSANISVGLEIYSRTFNILPFLVVLIVTTLFFLRLRFFDELKDYQYDLVNNPLRPLARNLISIKEAKLALIVLIFCELILVTVFISHTLIIYLSALLFSLMMYKEFFIGDLIRPHLTTYAILHTFISFLVGLFISYSLNHDAIAQIPNALILFGLVNWSLFNIFEFVRKTFQPNEERVGIESYSSLFNPFGAILLTLSQIIIINLITITLSNEIFSEFIIWWQFFLVFLFLAVSSFYLFSLNDYRGKILRTSAGIYIILAYLGFIV